MKRITKLLSEDELDIYAVKRDPTAKFALEVENGIFTWGGESKVENLKEYAKFHFRMIIKHAVRNSENFDYLIDNFIIVFKNIFFILL